MNKKTEAALLPCPFCGFDATIAIGIGNYSGACSDLACRAEGPVAPTPEEAAKQWNRRRSDGLRNWLKAEAEKNHLYARQHLGVGILKAVAQGDAYLQAEKQAEKLLDRPVQK